MVWVSLTSNWIWFQSKSKICLNINSAKLERFNSFAESDKEDKVKGKRKQLHAH